MTRRPGASALVAAGTVLALTAGCSSAGPAPGRSGGPVVRPSRPSPAPVTDSSTPSVPDPTAAATATATPSASTSPAPATPTGAPQSTCRSLLIRVIRGSAAPGFEFAALQFVNTGSTRCELFGYPRVTLLRGGAPVGRPSSPAGTATSSFTLEPGATAESTVKDYSSCQAPLSEQIQVVAPGSSTTVVRPGQLRACTLRVSALATPA